MGTKDRITGRVKQAAGDLLGHEELKRRGRQEERKADAQNELTEAEARVREKESEVRDLELRTDPARLARASSWEQLQDEAQRLGIEGRSAMTKEELAAAITARS